MELLSQHPQLSRDKETEGFDVSAGRIWIYPDNYPIRDYQFSIVQTALYNNTLVCLPTGLGKTFIAAVVMYNYWRWYPKGKVIFLAPTRPLVMQQVDACHNIMGIPSQEIEILIGTKLAKSREATWTAKDTRVIFATPQVFHNDLKSNLAPADLIKCVVVDEGHKALGKHSYTECIKILTEKNKYFRVLALSATPGNKITDVHAVVKNLNISCLEIRDENSPDIVPYTNAKQIKVIVVELGSVLEKYKERYITIMDRHVKFLAQCNVLHGDTANITKGKIFFLLKESKGNKSANHGKISKTLTILMTMYHAYDLLIRNGLRTFLLFYQSHSDKFWMHEETQLQKLLGEIKECLGPFPEFISPLAKEQDIPKDINFGHKKFLKLKELLVSHFTSDSPESKNSRAIVFVECRSAVNEVYVLLLQLRPLIRAQMFVGQSGLKQKQQIQMLENFRSNRINVLISTCIGEEGLDVGEVDLIICFDIVQVSPTRLVQRMGRTGRKRDGQVIILVTNGKEHETLQNSLRRRSSISNKILNTSGIFSSLYQENPRMIPDQLKPSCHKMFINAKEEDKPSEKSKKKGAAGKAKGKPKNSVKGSLLGDSKLNKSKGQSSIAKFFVNKPRDTINLSPVSPTGPSLTFQTQPAASSRTAIDPSDIKLLTSDEDAADFLTLSVLKLSSKDVQEETDSFHAKYIDTTTTGQNYFDFDVPDPSILDSLDSMMEHLPEVAVTCNDDNALEECKDEWGSGSFFDEVDLSGINNSFSAIKDSFCQMEDSFANYVTYDDFEQTDLNSAIPSPNTSAYNHEREQNLLRKTPSKSSFIQADFTDSDQHKPVNHEREENLSRKTSSKLSFIQPDFTDSDRFKPTNHEREENLSRNTSSKSLFIQADFTDSDRLKSTKHEREENLSRKTLSKSSFIQADITDSERLKPTNISTDNQREEKKSSHLDQSSEFADDLIEISSDDGDFGEYVQSVSNNANASSSNEVKGEVMKKNEEKKVVVKDDSIEDDIIVLDDDTSDSNTSCSIPMTQVDQYDITRKKIESSLVSHKGSLEKHNFSSSKRTNDNDTSETKFNFSDNKATKPNDIFESRNIHSTPRDVNATCSSQTGEASLWDLSRAVAEIQLMNSESGSQTSQGKLRLNIEPENQTTRKTLSLKIEPDKPTTYFDSDDDLFAELDYEEEFVEQECAIVENSPPIIQKKENVEQKDSFIEKSAKINSQDAVLDKNLQGLDEIMDEFDSDFTSDWIDVADKSKVSIKSSSSSTPVTKGSTRKSLNFSKILRKQNTVEKSASVSLAEKLSSVKKSQENSFNKQPIDEMNDSDSDLIFNEIIDGLENNSPFFTASTSFGKSAMDSPVVRTRKTKQLVSDGKSESDPLDDSPFKVPGKYVNGQQKRITAKTAISSRKEIAASDKKSSRNKENHSGTTWRHKERRRRPNAFICDEAAVSSDEKNSSDETSEGDDDLSDFVSYTQNTHDDSNMYAHYLQSIRSPRNKRHGFVFKKPRSPEPDVQIYSQPLTQTDDTYIYDSFCVKEDEEEDESLEEEDSILIEAERALASRKRRRNKSTASTSKKKKKRRRIVEVSSTSSEDETEHSEGQIRKESLLQKRL